MGLFPTALTCFFPRRWQPEAWDLEAVAADPVRLLLVPSRDEGAAEVGAHKPISVGRQEMRADGHGQKSLGRWCWAGAAALDAVPNVEKGSVGWV